MALALASGNSSGVLFVYLEADVFDREQMLLGLIRDIDRHASDSLQNDNRNTKYLYRSTSNIYTYIPYSNARFMSALELIRKYFNSLHKYSVKFCDVGCGIGTKVAIAHQYFSEATGIEIRKKYVDKAKELFQLHGRRIKFILGNAFDHNYVEYDLIYYYCPIPKPSLMAKLETKIFREMKPNALVLAVGIHASRTSAHKKVNSIVRIDWGTRRHHNKRRPKGVIKDFDKLPESMALFKKILK